MLFIFLVIMIYSNSFHLGLKVLHMLYNYSNPCAFFSFFVLNTLDFGRWGNWDKEKIRHLLRSLCQDQKVSCDHTHRTFSAMQYMWSGFYAGRRAGEMHSLGSTLSREYLWKWRRALNLVVMTVGFSPSPSPGII